MHLTSLAPQGVASSCRQCAKIEQAVHVHVIRKVIEEFKRSCTNGTTICCRTQRARLPGWVCCADAPDSLLDAHLLPPDVKTPPRYRTRCSASATADTSKTGLNQACMLDDTKVGIHTRGVGGMPVRTDRSVGLLYTCRGYMGMGLPWPRGRVP